MALQPLWLQEVQYPARWDRILFDNIWTAGTLGPSALEVTPSSPAGMTVDVSAGVGVVTGTDQSFQGKYLVREEAATTGLVIAAAPGSGQRSDLIVVQVRDTNAGGASGDDAVIVVVPGTPSGSPVDPTPPASSLVLARVRVPAGTGSITAGLIDDLRVEATSVHDGLGAPAGAIMDTIASVAPGGWALLDGSTIVGGQSLYPRLWAVLPSTFKSGSNIVLPDMRGRVTVGRDSGTFATIGGTGGAQTHTLTTSEMPSHTHTQNSHNHTQNSHDHTASTDTIGAHIHKTRTQGTISGTVRQPRNGEFAFSGGTFSGLANTEVYPFNDGRAIITDSMGDHSHTVTVASQTATNVAQTATNQNTGGGSAHNILQPYIVVNKIIRLG